MIISYLILIIYLHRIMAFDVPNYEWQGEVYEKRYKHLLENINSDHLFTVCFI